MKYYTFILLISIALVGCKQEKEVSISEKELSQLVIQYEPITLTEQQANNLAALPLACIQQEYPNKLNQTIAGADDLKSPKELHPTFYGCFDWHSAVHGHWSLVALLKQYPNLNSANLARSLLKTNISKESHVF